MNIKTAVVNGVYTIEIARPEKKNAITMEMYQLMANAVHEAEATGSVRALLITGQPGIFTAGNDLEDFMKLPSHTGDLPSLLFMKALIGCTKPVVAAVTGVAIGIGATLLLHCDLVYMSDESHLSMPFVSLGLVPEFASSLLLPQLMGRVKAAEKLLLGDPVTAAEAVELGMANAVVPASEVVRHARRMAERFNTLPPAAVRDTKKLLSRTGTQQVQQTMAAEFELFAQRLTGPEAREALTAFFQKREPDFAQFS